MQHLKTMESLTVMLSPMLEHHLTMLNLTARIAVQMQNLPPWDVDWTDSQPQRHRSSLTCADFLPDEKDAAELHKRAVLYMMEVLVAEFRSLSSLKHLVPSRQSPHRLQRSVAVPMKVLFRDEKQKAETIEILSDLMKDAALTGNPQVRNEDNTYSHTLSPFFAATNRPLLGTN